MVLMEVSLKPKQINPFANQPSITFAMELLVSLQLYCNGMYFNEWFGRKQIFVSWAYLPNKIEF